MLLKVNEVLAFGDQESPEQLKALAQQGYKTIIDLCTPKESKQIPAERAREAGLALQQVPVAVDALNGDLVRHFIKVLEQSTAPVYTRCASGKRAGLMALLALATQQHWSEQEFFKQVEAAGFDCSSAPALAQFAHDYIQELQKQEPV